MAWLIQSTYSTLLFGKAPSITREDAHLPEMKLKREKKKKKKERRERGEEILISPQQAAPEPHSLTHLTCPFAAMAHTPHSTLSAPLTHPETALPRPHPALEKPSRLQPGQSPRG